MVGKRRLNPGKKNLLMYDFIKITKNTIEGIQSGARIDIIPADSHTSYGATPMVVVLSEFCNWPSGVQHEQFYTSCMSSFAKRADAGAVLIVETNAGYGKGWQYEAMNQARTSPQWYFSCPESYAPWYSAETVEEQRKFLSDGEFKRLWLNQWQSSDGSYISLEEMESCINPALAPREHGIPGFIYIATIDVGLKNDRTVMSVMHQLGGKIILDRMDVFEAEMYESKTVPIEIVEEWMHRVAKDFGRVIFVPDQYQMVSIIRKLETVYEIYPFDFASGLNNWRMSYTLRQLVAAHRLEVYPEAGAMYRGGQRWNPYNERDDLFTEVANLEIKELPSGRWRFTHSKGRHDDRAFALGAGCLFIMIPLMCCRSARRPTGRTTRPT